MDREQQSTRPGATRATPAKTPARGAKPKPGRSSGKGTAATPSATTAPDIMSRLPKSRPQRASQRRRSAAPAAAKTTARAATASPKAASAAKRTPAARRPAAARATPARPPAASGSGPGLPRIAIDGATEAVKLPLKVSGRLTLKALDAVARGLRRR